MIFKKIDIRRQLDREKDPSSEFLKDVQIMLGLAASRDEEILRRLRTKKNIPDPNNLGLVIAPEEEKNVYSIEQIEKICTNYRLKFLDTSYFKAEFPYEAVMAINSFEKKHNTKIKHFKIIAPGNMFNLEDCDTDPLLFAQLASGKYYLLHKWGNDLAWYRGILCYPFRNIYSLFFTLVLFAGIIAWSIPSGWINQSMDLEISIKAWLWVHTFIGLFGFALFLGGIFQRNFSDDEWRSRYFNG